MNFILIKNLLDTLLNNKVYVRILQALSIMENFSRKTNVKFYDTCEDENGIIKNEILSNKKKGSLAKKFDINYSNIKLTKIDKRII